MNTKLILAGLLAAPAAIAMASPAAAQVQGIATASPTAAIANSKAYVNANQQISTTNKAIIDQINARQDQLDKELQPLYAQLDLNKDKRLSDDEIQAAEAAKSPALASIRAAQDRANTDIMRVGGPVIRARLFVLEKILENYGTAQNNVVKARNIAVILQPSAFLYAPQSVDVTPAISAEIDKVLPSVPTQPPANWNPSQTTISMLEQISDYEARRAQAQAAQQPAAGPAPAAGQPAPAKPAPQKPQTR